MRGKDLYEKMSDIDDEIIANVSNSKKASKPIYIKWLALAACLVVVITATFFINSSKGTDSPELLMLKLNTEFSGGQGFEGYMAYDISDLVNNNPWNEEMGLTHLPVIKNKLTFNGFLKANKPDYDLMEKLLKETAQSYGMDAANIPVTNDIPSDETKKSITEKFDGLVPAGYFDISRMFMENDNYKLEVNTSNSVAVNFKQPFELPSEYNFTFHATYEEKYKVAEYLKEEYAAFIGMIDPIINISGGDYNSDLKQSYSITFYEHSSDDVHSILNYHFNTVAFYCDDRGALFLARKYYTNLSEVVGEYPIINSKEALALLENGNYITTVPQAFKGKEYVKKVELVYRTGTREELFIPYYKFYVELPSMSLENGLKNYGAYYVVAVEGQYIENMPKWNGEFN